MDNISLPEWKDKQLKRQHAKIKKRDRFIERLISILRSNGIQIPKEEES